MKAVYIAETVTSATPSGTFATDKEGGWRTFKPTRSSCWN